MKRFFLHFKEVTAACHCLIEDALLVGWDCITSDWVWTFVPGSCSHWSWFVHRHILLLSSKSKISRGTLVHKRRNRWKLLIITSNSRREHLALSILGVRLLNFEHSRSILNLTTDKIMWLAPANNSLLSFVQVQDLWVHSWAEFLRSEIRWVPLNIFIYL